MTNSNAVSRPTTGKRPIWAWLIRVSTIGMLVLGAALLVLAVATGYGLHTQPTADDFCRAALSTGPGDWIRSVHRNYLVWSGRWLAHGLYALIFPHIGVTTAAYGRLVALSGLMWTGVFYMFISILAWDRLKVLPKLGAAVVMTALFWTTMPSAAEVWFWLTGMVEYALPFACFVGSAYVATRPSVIRRFGLMTLVGFVAASVLGVAVSALNELVGLMLVGVMALAAVLALVQRRPGLAVAYGMVAVVTAVGVFFNLSAPGTGIRTAADFPNAYDLKTGIALAFFRPDLSPLRWLFDGRLVLLSLLLLLNPAFLRFDPPWKEWKLPFISMSLFVPILGLAAVYASLFVITYAEGTTPPARLETLIYALFLMGSLASLVVLQPLMKSQDIAETPFAERIYPVLGAFAAGALVFAPQTVTAMVDLRYFMPVWNQAIEARERAIASAAARSQSEVLVQPVPLTPRLLFWRELSTDPSSWRNTCYARYLKVDSVRVAAKPPAA
jgi:hypothetical protein